MAVIERKMLRKPTQRQSIKKRSPLLKGASLKIAIYICTTPNKTAMISSVILNPHIQKNENFKCLPISKPDRPSANHTAGASGDTNVPTMLPMIIAYAVDNESMPYVKPIWSTTGNNAK